MKNLLKRFDRTPKIILYVTSDGITETPHRIECPANQVDKFLARPDIVAWKMDFRQSANWSDGDYHLWFDYDWKPLKEKHHPLAYTPCILFMIDLKTGDKMERSGAGDGLLEFAKSENPPSTAWAVYKKVYSAMSYINKINSIIFVESNELWSPHYADRFGYVVDKDK